MIKNKNWWKLVLLSLRSNSQTQRYIYKIVIVYVQAVSITWYAFISTNTYHFGIYHISLEIIWWVLSNASLIVQICPVVHEILANKDFTVTDDLISQLFVVAFVYPTYVQIALIWGFTVQLSLWKSVHWLWRYKLNEVCDSVYTRQDCLVHPSRWVLNNYTYYYFLIIFFFIAAPLPMPGALHSSSGVYSIPLPSSQPWSSLIAGF